MSVNKESTRQGFGRGLIKLADERNDVVMTAADTYRSFKLGPFVEKFKDRYFEFGIAEQDMLLSSAGLATDGNVVFAVGYSTFLSMRALEQFRTFICYPHLNVKVIAGLGGLSGDTDGVTHQGTEDLGIVRSLPGVTLVCPADSIAAEKMVPLIADVDGPVYFRLGRGGTPVFYESDVTFEIGKAHELRTYGHDAVIVATGPCVYEAMVAADEMKEEGVNVTVLDMHTVKPLDKDTLLKHITQTKNVYTVEDGTIFGGLGSAVAEVIAEETVSAKLHRLGLTTFGTAGSMDGLLDFFGINAKGIKAAVYSER